jgi:hypothetical protein
MQLCDQKGRVVGGILDPRYDRSYYTLVPCPTWGDDVTLSDHRDCEHFGGVHFNAESGMHQVFCRREAE